MKKETRLRYIEKEYDSSSQTHDALVKQYVKAGWLLHRKEKIDSRGRHWSKVSYGGRLVLISKEKW